jgi:Ca-activated chloride channel family protein
VQWEYSEWDQKLQNLLQSFQNLMSLFNYLLLMAGGDVDKVFKWMEYLQERGSLDPDVDLEEFRRQLEEQRIVERLKDGSYSLTAKGEQVIRKDSLNQIFNGLQKTGFGQHRVAAAGSGEERLTETRPWRFGDPVTQIDALGTISNAVARGGVEEINLAEEDFEVYETEHLSSCATMLLIDISHSMILYGEDRITPAKQVALALTELILTRYPKDTLRVGVFGDEAREIAIKDIPYLQVGPYHTNTRAGLQMAQSILEGTRQSNRQIFMVTDGKPTALTENGEVYKNPFGLDPKIQAQTLEAASACRRAGITITTFMLARDPELVEFVEELTRLAHGRAYFAAADRLGEFLFADYSRNKRRTLH